MKTLSEITTILERHGFIISANASNEKITQLIFAKQSRRVTVMKCSRWPHTSVVVWEQPKVSYQPDEDEAIRLEIERDLI